MSKRTIINTMNSLKSASKFNQIALKQIYHWHQQSHIHSISSSLSHGKFLKFLKDHSNINGSKYLKKNIINNNINYNVNIKRHFNASSEQKRDYYDVLGVNRDAKDSEVKKAFYKVA